MTETPYSLDKVAIRMVKEPPLYSSTPVRSPDDAVRLMAEMLKGYDREVFCIVNFRNDMTPINMNIVSMGTLNVSLVHPREIIYGHHMQNGTMFAGISWYEDQSYYDEHPVMYLMTPSATYRIELFSGYITTMDSSAYMQNFGSVREHTDWLEEVSGRSDFRANLEISAYDRVSPFPPALTVLRMPDMYCTGSW